MFTLNCKGRLLPLDKPLVMGIINTTPDSFYRESRQENTNAVLRKAEQMIREGATILDMGGQSTRPGSEKLGPDEELQRVLDPVDAVSRAFPEVFISIDTYYAKVAQEAVDAGASIVNDISAGSLDPGMIGTVAALKVPYILMHMKGTPQNMQEQAHYDHITKEVLDFMIRKTDVLRQAGIVDIIIDPGFGFGKTIPHNFELLRNLQVLSMLQCPLLMGISRKSVIYKTLGVSAAESLIGTTVLHTVGLMNGASLLRVHDVKEAVETIRLFEAYRNSGQ